MMMQAGVVVCCRLDLARMIETETISDGRKCFSEAAGVEFIHERNEQDAVHLPVLLEPAYPIVANR
jgi:hypothetical protein